MLSKLAENCLSLPVSNAWPERGASALRRIKTRLRSRLSNTMLQSLLQITINGPSISSKELEDVIEDCVKVWTLRKNRRKLPRPATTASQQNAACITLIGQPVEMADAAVQVSDDSDKEKAEKVMAEVKRLSEEVELASAALKLNAIPLDCIDDEYFSETEFTDEDSD